MEKSGRTSDGDEDEEEEDDEEDENEEDATAGELLYDGKEFEDLAVGPDVKQVFSFIGLYSARNMELELKLKPFIPDLMPAVGDIDAFIKVSAGSCSGGGSLLSATQNSLQVISSSLSARRSVSPIPITLFVSSLMSLSPGSASRWTGRRVGSHAAG